MTIEKSSGIRRAQKQDIVNINGRSDPSLAGKTGVEIAKVLHQRRKARSPAANARAQIAGDLRLRGLV